MGEGSELMAASRPLPRALRGTGMPPESAEQLRAQGVRTMRRERRAVSLLRRPCQHEARRCPHGRGAQGSLACPPPPSLRTHRTHSLLRSLPRPPPPPTLHRAPCTLHPPTHREAQGLTHASGGRARWNAGQEDHVMQCATHYLCGRRTEVL